jgi:putative addiction module killer protein
MATQPREIERYVTADGQIPFDDWFYSIRLTKTQTIISKRLDRVRMGTLGDYRSVGGDVFELRIDYGPGYRIYFGQVGTTIITHLEEDEFEFDPELLKMALRNVLEALGDSHLPAEQIGIHEQFLDKLLKMPAEIAIYNLEIS